MTLLRTTALSLAVVGLLAAGAVAGSQAYAEPATHTAVTTGQGGGTETGASESWTRKKWKEWSSKMSKEKEKWAECRAKSKEQKLRGRKSWSFIYACMTGKS